jgi:MoaA/NifB/PqqE/SkfB family radical SAM enzyme
VLQPLRRRARKGTEALLRRNARLVRRVLDATGRDEAPLPEIVQIESTNICNAKCVFCPRDEMARKQGVMDMELFKKVVDECVELGIEHVRMHNYGEPFVDRQLVDKVRYAKQKGVPQVGMISNGSLITETAARGMIEAGLDAINISVDASGKEVFERTRVGLKYDKVIANVERLLALRHLASRFGEIPHDFVVRLANDNEAMIRAYAAWLLGRSTFYITGKAERDLGWKPMVTYEEGVRRAVDWYRSVNP